MQIACGRGSFLSVKEKSETWESGARIPIFVSQKCRLMNRDQHTSRGTRSHTVRTSVVTDRAAPQAPLCLSRRASIPNYLPLFPVWLSSTVLPLSGFVAWPRSYSIILNLNSLLSDHVFQFLAWKLIFHNWVPSSRERMGFLKCVYTQLF